MSEAAYVVMGLAVVAIVAVVLGALALYFGRAASVKGAGLEVGVSEPSTTRPAPSSAPLGARVTKPNPKPAQGKKVKKVKKVKKGKKPSRGR